MEYTLTGIWYLSSVIPAEAGIRYLPSVIPAEAGIQCFQMLSRFLRIKCGAG